MNLKERSEEIEIMDDLNIAGEVVDQTLRELDVINRNLGGNQVSLAVFKKLLKEKSPRSLVDLGCGGADILMDMAKIAKDANPPIQFFGVDANQEIVDYANKNTAAWDNIHCEKLNIFSEAFAQKSFDIIHCCLFTHHFTSDELVILFKQWKTQAKIAIIINDLHRHWLAYYSIKWITGFFSSSYMVKNDAAVSVARGFKKRELLDILTRADLTNYKIKWKWAFRWQLVVYI
ncbi:MAG: methyltransferase domain-containing protein [Cyclobacteriaceae bacterium]